ncbi:MAG: hypothetical protein HGB33_05540 [Syntrophaceae bacterium]|nr:hypothetical protein [Syntrophaceae bacterium]
MVRIGNSFFGHRKDADLNGLHSGSGKVTWIDPGIDLLDVLKRVTDEGRFASMDVDVFIASDGRLLVNECQTVFGCSIANVQMRINGVEGRYLRIDDRWQFDAGEFSRNHMCNLRIEYLLSQLNVMYDK